MKALYPLAIDSPIPDTLDRDGKVVIPGKPWNQVIVRTPDEHKTRFPEHYEKFQQRARREAAAPQTTAEAVLAERNRAAAIASNFPKGGVIAKAIAEAIRAEPSESDELESAPVTGEVVEPKASQPVTVPADSPDAVDAPKLPVLIQAEAPALR